MTSAKIIRMIDAYKNTLKVYGVKEVKLAAAAAGASSGSATAGRDKNRQLSSSLTAAAPLMQEFDERIDCLMVLMCRTCPYLTVLVSV